MSTHLRAARLTSVKPTARPLLQRADAQKRYYTDRPRPSSRPTRSLGRFVLYSVSAFLGAHVFARYFYYCDATYGVSMLPTIQSFGDWVVVSKYYRRGRGVQVGDIVSFKHPAREGEFAIKRVIGMGGDFVLMNTPEHSDAMIQVPQGHCWVVGDNMKHSRDSRMFGPLPLALIHGKAITKLNWTGILPSISQLEHGLRPAELDSELD